MTKVPVQVNSSLLKVADSTSILYLASTIDFALDKTTLFADVKTNESNLDTAQGDIVLLVNFSACSSAVVSANLKVGIISSDK